MIAARFAEDLAVADGAALQAVGSRTRASAEAFAARAPWTSASAWAISVSRTSSCSRAMASVA